MKNRVLNISGIIGSFVAYVTFLIIAYSAVAPPWGLGLLPGGIFWSVLYLCIVGSIILTGLIINLNHFFGLRQNLTLVAKVTNVISILVALFAIAIPIFIAIANAIGL